MDRRERFNGLELKDHAVVHQEIGAVSAFYEFAFVLDGDGPLRLKCKATQGELTSKATLIGAETVRIFA